MFAFDRVLSHINYVTLNSTCQGSQACAELMETASASSESESDKETDIVEYSVLLHQPALLSILIVIQQDLQPSRPHGSFIAYVSNLPATIWDSQNIWLPQTGTIAFGGTLNFSELVRKQAHTGASWPESHTRFSAFSIDDLADQILTRLDRAIYESNFLGFMGKLREFDMYVRVLALIPHPPDQIS